jgi:microcystin-dependent protein
LPITIIIHSIKKTKTMIEPMLGEISIFAGDFPPKGWEFCDGRKLLVKENNTLFQLLGNMYGGDGVIDFALPDLRGRVAIHRNDSYPQGVKAGLESVALTTAELPVHTHIIHASTSTANDNGGPEGGFWGGSANDFGWMAAPGTLSMNNESLTVTGGGQPHENRIPVQAATYIIATTGVFPSRS